jgi:hypothetical protein
LSVSLLCLLTFHWESVNLCNNWMSDSHYHSLVLLSCLQLLLWLNPSPFLVSWKKDLEPRSCVRSSKETLLSR